MEPIRFSETGAEGVLYHREDRIAYLALDRPDKLNAFNDGQVLALKRAMHHFDTDEDAWVAILSGHGRAFSSGADVVQRHLRNLDEIRALGGIEGQGASVADLFYQSANWKPIIAAVHGYALGMALGLVLQAELAVVTEDAQLQITEVSRGGGGALYWMRLQFRGAGTFADDVAITGRYFSGREAAANGVVTKAVPPNEHLAGARALAEQVLQNPPLSVRANVRARRYYAQRHEFEWPLFLERSPLYLSEDFREGALAFAEGRPRKPFTGRWITGG